MRRATFLIFSGSATDEPPNFITTRFVAVACVIPAFFLRDRRHAAAGARVLDFGTRLAETRGDKSRAWPWGWQMKAVAVSLVVGFTLTISAVGAVGSERAAPVKVDDPKGDNTPDYADIQSIAAVAAAGKISWTIATYTSFTKYTAPCVFVKSVKPTGLTWSICRLSAGAAPPCYTSVNTHSPYPAGGGCGGPASIRLFGTKTVVYTVPLTMFTRFKPVPAAIQWRAEVRALKGCYPTACDQTSFGHTVLGTR
jgi:hypothetical protein